MTTLDTIATGSAVGAFLPLLTAVVQRPHWSVRTKKIVAVITALVAGVVTVAYVGGPEQFQHGLPTFATLAAVLAASQSAYDLVWKPTSIAPVIEAVTSPNSAPTVD
ncbi:hypothetical protein ACFVHW_04500 [Streptomyces sp. NPDC127110]|uniref:hypothetical protein n=1 Tax=Streptomyces sp. NPDC127110 TaxID=3345362 RepID=UPI00363F6FC4